ncbi:MAG: hypothetical protein Q4F29_08935 [Lachnospiraceae bacterium]|nr:hypothetical protein [Lachnospiraceae bacterium]
MTRFRWLNWWISKKMENVHLFLAILGICVCLAGELAAFPSWTAAGRSFLLLVVLVHLIHKNLHYFGYYLKQYEDTDRLPAEQMKQVNGFLLGIFSLIFLAVSLGGLLLPWGHLGRLLKQLVTAFLRWLLKWLPGAEPELVPETETGQADFSMPELPAGETSALALFLDRFLTALCWCLIGAAVVWFLIKQIRRLVEYLGNLHLDEDEKVFLRPEAVEDQLERRKAGGSARRGWHFLGKRRLERTNEGRIRRMYQRRIEEGIRSREEAAGRLSYMTPEELEEAAALADSERIAHGLYEAARYSREGSSAEDVEKMRKQLHFR